MQTVSIQRHCYSRGNLSVAGTSQISISQVRYLCQCHYVLNISLFGVSAKIFRDMEKIHQVFCLCGTVSVKLSESGNPLKVFHVTDISTFNDDDE